MNYFKVEGDTLTRFNVELNQEKLISLKEEIIEKCSLIEQKKTTTFGLVDYSEDSIRNVKREKLTATNPSLPHLPSEDIYYVEYDEYNYPELVSLIDKLLSGDTSVISQIENPNFDELEKKQKEVILREVKGIMNNSSNLDIAKQTELLALNQQKALKISLSREYFSKVLDCIVLKPISKLSSEYLEETILFFADNNEDETTLGTQVNKILLMKNSPKISNDCL